jgi:Flp pilus assembly pilin Flp
MRIVSRFAGLVQNKKGSIFMEEGLLVALCVVAAVGLIAAIGALIVSNWQEILDILESL